jgi:L-cysteine:1D-myo-inositol 2-amino-2-deoxy-alpha-D-glucopyranoside ligase
MTAKTSAALNGWATNALEYVGHDTGATRSAATAIGALLEVDL